MKKIRCAFFDVDGTVLNTRSMFSFLDYIAERYFSRHADFQLYYSRLYKMISSRTRREEINRFYYSFLNGLSANWIASMGREWFSAVSARPGFYNEAMLCQLSAHKTDGAKVILVTGSFIQILRPLVEQLKVDGALCTIPEVKDEVFTGAIVGLPCIGEGKVAAIRRYANDNAVNLDECVAYGDDQTDLPMLKAVGSGELVRASQIYRDEFDDMLQRAISLNRRIVTQ